jgi:hypothetical protein
MSLLTGLGLQFVRTNDFFFFQFLYWVFCPFQSRRLLSLPLPEQTLTPTATGFRYALPILSKLAFPAAYSAYSASKKAITSWRWAKLSFTSYAAFWYMRLRTKQGWLCVAPLKVLRYTFPEYFVNHALDKVLQSE